MAAGAQAARHGPSPGSLTLAVASAVCFAAAGPLAKSLIDAGWSAQAAMAVRIWGAAAVMLPAVVLAAWPSRGRLLVRHAGHFAAFGLIAVVGAQLGFFNAVRTLPVGVALLIEYLSPLLVAAWLWAVHRQRPTRLTASGAAVALAGTVLIVDPFGSYGLDRTGVLWALFAACCSAGYFILGARQHDDLPPAVTVGVGLVVASVAVLLGGATGLLPLVATQDPVALGDAAMPWWVPVVGLIVLPGVLAYLLGIAAVLRLGSRLASFIALSEVLLAVLAAWWLLAQVPSWLQAIGGALVVAGILLVRAGEPGAVGVPELPEVSPGTGRTTPAAPGT